MRIIIETDSETSAQSFSTSANVGEATEAGGPSEDLMNQISEESLEVAQEGDGDAIDAGPPPQDLVEAIEGVASLEGEDAGAAPYNEV